MYKLKEKLLPFQLCLIFNQIAVAFEEVSNAWDIWEFLSS